MIVRIMSRGKSFKGLSAYLIHDPNADTEERVGWTHTLNLANDHVPSAVNEMVWTARDAELLKQEAGIRAGGRATENTVKHVSLNWAPGEQPTKEHMIEASNGFLTSMGWHEQQTVIVAHTDKAYAHAHLMIGVCHPVTGLKLNDAFERRRAQEWALGYEREQGRVHCEQRLKDPRERQDAPTREAWLAFEENRKAFERTEAQRHAQGEKTSEPANNGSSPHAAEWAKFKNMQKSEREAFFVAGKSEFSDLRLSIYQEVREEFRGRWSELYAAQRNGAYPDVLLLSRLGLIAEQRDCLGERRDTACKELRDSRDQVYRDLLDRQRETRLGFKEDLAAGRDTSAFFAGYRPEMAEGNATAASSFRAAATETTQRTGSENVAPAAERSPDRHEAKPEPTRSASGRSGIGGFGLGLLSLGESLFATFIAAQPAPKSQDRDERDPFEAAAEESAKRLHREREDADEKWRQRRKETARD